MHFYFPPDARLRKRYEFNTVFKMGCKFNTPHFVLLLKTSSLPESRLGITVSRKVGNAVVRNRLKRIIREFFRINRTRFKDSTDVSIIAKRGAGQMSTAKVWDELENIFSRLF